MSTRWPLPAVAVALLADAAPLGAQRWRTLDAARQLADSAPVTVRVDYGAGRVHLYPARRGTLYEVHVRYDAARARPLVRWDAATRTARLGAAAERMSLPTERGAGGELRVALTADAPLDLGVELGAADVDLDLTGLRLARLRVATRASDVRVRFDAPNPASMERLEMRAGAAALRAMGLADANAGEVELSLTGGSALLDFGGRWTRDVALRLESTVAAVTLAVPADVGVQVEGGSRLGDVEGLLRRGDLWVSPNWDRATHRLRVTRAGRVSRLAVRRR